MEHFPENEGFRFQVSGVRKVEVPAPTRVKTKIKSEPQNIEYLRVASLRSIVFNKIDRWTKD
jgi:hypothetical protein